MIGRVVRVFLILAFSASRLAAQQEPPPNPHAVQPERPTVATHAGTVAPGWFEIETGVERDQFNTGMGIGTPTTLKLGIGSHQQLSIWGSVPQPDSSSFGVGDLFVGVKWRLLDDAKIIGDFAILPSIKLPTGSVSAGRGTGTTDGSLLLISSHDFSGVAMDINAGYTRRSGNGSQAPVNATLWTVSFGGPAVNQFGWVAETYGFPATTGAAGQAAIVAFLAGPTYQPKEWLAFDAGVIIPITGPQPHALYAGGVWNVGKVW
jgi:hypothetical protein